MPAFSPRTTVRLLAASLIGFTLPSAASAFDADQKAAIETIVRDYLIANPEVLEEAFTALQTKREAAEEASRREALTAQKDRLFDSEHQAVMGNPDGDVTVVEFFDYNCGFCKRAFEDVMRLVEADGNVRVVLKEFPVLGRGSMEAAQVSIAVNAVAPQAFEEFHGRLMMTEQPADLGVALAIVDAMDLPRAEIEAAMGAPNVRANVEEVYDLANALGLTGTPAFVVGDEVLFGAVGFDRLKEQVQFARCGEATC